jgi:hypothetical protein
VSIESFGILLNSYFDGATGMRLQQCGNKDAFILGAFLMANEWANMIGLYEISMVQLERKLPIVKTRAAMRKALDVLSDENYAHYDQRTEFVWVREMARVRLQLKGLPLHSSDKRLLGALKLYTRLPQNPFLRAFYERYSEELRLPLRHNPDEAHTEAPSKPLHEAPWPDPPITSGDQEIRRSVDQVSVDQKNRRTAASPQSPSAAEHYKQILVILHKEILPTGVTDIGDLEEATKGRCAALRIPYNSEVVRKAVESALHQRRRA